MERLWTPWRLAYVTEASTPAPGCIFCAALAALDAEPLVVHRASRSFVVCSRTLNVDSRDGQKCAEEAGLQPFD